MTLRFVRKLPTEKLPSKTVAEAFPPQAQPPKPSQREPATEPSKPAAPQPTDLIRDQVLLRIEPMEAVRLSRGELMIFVNQLVALVAGERKLLLNQEEQDELAVQIVDEMVGLGPIEPLLNDPGIADILINGADKIYAERSGKLQRTNLRFRNNAHVLHVAQRIASSIGRSVDEASPMLDARLADGSRVNVIIPPLSLNGPSISIRKFSKQMLGFSSLVSAGSMSPAMARVLEIAARCRLNIIISGGTGSGKTTMLNALSSMIDENERIVTIEDAAELQLQQEHVVRLETRPANIEGTGLVDQRALVKNALRMRPDRIIMGECRGEEAFDMMQAMNTGHAGSMSTIHANRARDALARLENMIMMANANLPTRAIRGQIASAVDMIVHTERMRDGVRRITEITEIGGMEEDVITLGTLFKFKYSGEGQNGALQGHFESTPSRPRFLGQIAYYGLAEDFRDALSGGLEKQD